MGNFGICHYGYFSWKLFFLNFNPRRQSFVIKKYKTIFKEHFLLSYWTRTIYIQPSIVWSSKRCVMCVNCLHFFSYQLICFQQLNSMVTLYDVLTGIFGRKFCCFFKQKFVCVLVQGLVSIYRQFNSPLIETRSLLKIY